MMRFKYSLAYPIIIIISLVAAVTLVIGYYLNLYTLRETIEAREADRARAIYFTVKDKITNEIQEMVEYSQILKKNPQLLDGLRHYQAHGDLERLKKAMNHLYSPLMKTEVDFFLVTDRQSNMVYRASPRAGVDDLSRVWGMEEALSGKDSLSAGFGPLGWNILSLVPLAEGDKQYGVLVLGISLTDDVARRMAKATHNHISFSTGLQILASSWPAAERRHVNLAQVTESILGKNSIYFNNNQANLSSFYIPVEIVDETICLVINTDTSPIADLLREKRKYLLLVLLAVLVVTVSVGSGLAVTIVRPLKKLQARSLGAIKDFSQQDITLTPWGNEIETLSQALELMLSAIRLHVQDLHQAQETLRKGKLFLDNVFASIQDGLFVLDLNFNIMRANPVLQERFGPNPLVGQKCYRVIHGATTRCKDCPSRQAIETGTTSYRLKPVLIGGTERWMEIRSFPLRNQDTGEITGVIEYSRDVTEIKATEDALRRSEEQLRQAAKMEAVGRLAGGVAHDFNNILTVIMGECELLLQHLPEQDPGRQGVTGIIEATRRAASMTQHLLAFSRKQVLQPHLLDLNAVVADMDRMLRRILGEDIALVTIPAPDLGTVRVDPNQFEQVILNLAANARDAMSRGGSLTIETANVDLDEDYARQHVDAPAGSYVMLAMSDTGVGLEEAARPHIFEPFFTTKEVGKGTGLGLSMVYGIVKQSQGHICVYSEAGQGTTFKIYLPRHDQPPQNLTEPLRPLEIADGGAETILLVEDEGAVRTVVSRMLTQAGYQVLAAAEPLEAIRVSQDHQGPINLLFTDVVMPGMSGREMAAEIQAQHPQLKVLFMSGYTENAIFRHGVLEPGIAFINKPFKYETLIKKVREVLDALPPSQPGSPPKS